MNNESSPPAFPCGLTVYLRSSLPDGSIHRVPFPEGRNVVHENNPSDVWYQIYDVQNSIIGIFHVDHIAFILPIPPEVVSPPDANN